MHFVVGEIGAATLGRHHARLPLVSADGVLDERLLAFRDPRSPCRLVTGLRRARQSGFVTRLAHLREDLLAAQAAVRRRCLGHHDGADRLDSLEYALFVFVRIASSAGEQLRQQSDDRDRYQEREQDNDDELLRSLDR